MKSNNFCIWSLKPSLDYPEASTFRYNQTEEEGNKLADEMTKNSWSELSQSHFEKCNTRSLQFFES